MWQFRSKTSTKPRGLRWRCSMWYATFVAFFGLMSDTIAYSIILPIMPYQLELMGYHDVPSRVGWLLFAYSAGLVISTPLLASCSERLNSRQIPLILALIALILSQLLFIFGRRYWVMCVARVIQGISSSGVLSIGLALICDATPKKHTGRQLGIGMAGFSIGYLVGPPVSGALYAKFGFSAPFYFAMAFAGIDLFARLLLIERKDAIRWGVDPAADPAEIRTFRLQIPTGGAHSVDSFSSPADTAPKKPTGLDFVVRQTPARPEDNNVVITPLDVLLKLVTSPRALVCIFSTFIYGVIYSGQESVLVLHLADVYHLDAYKAGLAFIAAIIPTLISMPWTGYFSDNYGAEWVSFLSLLLGVPWWGAITIKGNLVQFLVIYSFETLFTSGLVSPLMTELAAVSQSIEGVGYAHVYGSFNLAIGIGSSVGPVLCGQIYNKTHNAWTIISLISLSLLTVCLAFSVAFTGERPLLRRVLSLLRKRETNPTYPLGMDVFREASSMPEHRDWVKPGSSTASSPFPPHVHTKVP